MRYPTVQEKQLVDKIATREKQLKMLAAGGVQAVMQQLGDEIAQLKDALTFLHNLQRHGHDH